MKITYIEKRFSKKTRQIIQQADEIMSEYSKQGYDLTLRQLYYQFVARDLIKNSQKEYKRLGSIINDARLAGKLDWDLIVDRTRNLISPSTWNSPGEIVQAAADSYRRPLWASQPNYVELWVEKEALAGVFGRICDKYRLPLFCCRGFVSQSEMWSAARRFIRKNRQQSHILHFGDHDPSGIDMTRDIVDRVRMFSGEVLEVHRLALNEDQIDEYDPPPNPVKTTDSRSPNYIEKFGEESWELDALSPDILSGIVDTTINDLIDQEQWQIDLEIENQERQQLQNFADTYQINRDYR